MAVQSTSSKQAAQSVYVLHTYPYKETSLIVELFSRDFGRITTNAKGARRPRSAMRGMLQSFQPMEAGWSGKTDIKTLHGLEWAGGLLMLKGQALICGFYLNELLMRLLPREDPHEDLFTYYQETLLALSKADDYATILRQFELRLLQELGYAVPLLEDEQHQTIQADKQYQYLPERGACDAHLKHNGVQIMGQTLIDMSQENYQNQTTKLQSKQIMRQLLAYYLGDKPLHTRQLLVDLLGIAAV
jgi:DNA repair protein RecO (recombination protein O)